MIQTKNDLQRFLSLEKASYLYGDRRDTLIAYLTNDPRVQVWRYQKRLRICEYRYNNRHKTPLHFFAFLLARRRKNHLGSRLGIEISENIFDEGLRIHHYGNIVINGDSRIGKNCALHGANCIGNAATDFAAPPAGRQCRHRCWRVDYRQCNHCRWNSNRSGSRRHTLSS